MKYALAEIYARRVGAIGIKSRYLVPTKGESDQALELNLYDRYEHVSLIGMREITQEEYETLIKSGT